MIAVRLGTCCDIMEMWCDLDASESGRNEVVGRMSLRVYLVVR
jgi:hypothetical protein